MRRLLLALFALILLRGDMYQDAGNAKLPEARENLIYTPARCDGVTASDGVLAAASGSFSSASTTFVAADVGKTITIANAGPRKKLLTAPVQAPGTGYAPGEIIQLALGTGGVGTAGKLYVLRTKVVSATIAAAGTGGTDGTRTVTGTSGSVADGGVRFSASVTVSGGAITAINSITAAGSYVVDMTSRIAEPVVDFTANLAGAKLNVVTGVDIAIPMHDLGLYTTAPSNPVAQASTSLLGTGATFNPTFFNENLVTTIASLGGDAHTVNLAAINGSGNSLTARYFGYGTNQTAIIQAALDAHTGPVILPPSSCMAGKLTLANGRTLIGAAGLGQVDSRSSRLIYSGPAEDGQLLFESGGVLSGTLVGNMELDGAGNANYGIRAIGLTTSNFLPVAGRNHTTYGVALGANAANPVQDVNWLAPVVMVENNTTNLNSNNAIGFDFGTESTTTSRNVNFMTVPRLRAATYNGIPIVCSGSDSNTFGNVRAAVTGTYAADIPGIELRGSNGPLPGNACTENTFKQVNSAAGGLASRGFNYTIPATRNAIDMYAYANGAGPPRVEYQGGSYLACTTDRDNEGCDRAGGTHRGRAAVDISSSLADRDLYLQDSGAYLSNRGALAGSNRIFTLPASNDNPGTWYCFAKHPQGDRLTITPRDAGDLIQVNERISSSAGTSIYTTQSQANICLVAVATSKWRAYGATGAWVGNTVDGAAPGQDVRAFGAACDVVTGIDGSMTSGSAVLTSAGSTFPASAIGKRVVVAGVGASPFSVLEQTSTINTAGSGYAANDTITMAGGTFSTAAVVQVLTVSSGAVATFAVMTAGVYTVTAATLTQGSTSGGGTGFVLNSKFVGSPLTGTITAASGGSTATLSATASNTISGNARWYYGTDDATALQAALNATKTTGAAPGQAVIPAAGCGTTVQLELPVVPSPGTVIGQGEIWGTNQAQSTIYAFSPMTSVLHRNNTFGWYGGVRNLRIEANYLADMGLYIEGSVSSNYRDIFVENAKVAGYKFGNGTDSITQVNGDHLDYRTNPNIFSQAQLPLHGIWLVNGSLTDSAFYYPTITGALTNGILSGGAGNHIIAPHVYGAPSPGYCPTYGIQFNARSSANSGHIDCARTAGYYITAPNVSVSDTMMNLFTGLPNAYGVEIADGICHVAVSGITAVSTSMRGAKLIQQDGTACASTTAQNNSSATYSAYGSAGSGIQVLQFLPADPTGADSPSVQKMMGLGSTVAFTPRQSGRLKISVSGHLTNDTGTTNGTFTQIRYGTGAAPSNGDAVTGTAAGNTQTTQIYAAGRLINFSTQALVTGLTPGTAYWIDLGLGTLTAGTGSAKKLTFIVEEL